MNLEIFNNLKENKLVQNFIKELKKDLGKKISDEDEKGILKQIQSHRNTSIVSRNMMRNKMSEILIKYSKETLNKGEMYFVTSKKNDTYTIFKYENNKENVIKISENDLPNEVKVNSILRTKNGKYVLDKLDTEIVVNEIIQMANNVLEMQDKQLDDFRKEDNLYMVEEDRNDRIYLTNISDKSDNIVLEEVDFPKELLDKATEGTVFQYKNGEYLFYSRDGFERIYENNK